MAALVSLPVLCKKSLWLGSFFFMFLAGSAQLTSFNFHHLTTEQGLSNSTIRSIAQDKYGFIWIGTLNGLNLFNGYSVKSFYKGKLPNELPNLAITALAADAKGELWVGTRTTLCYYDYNSGNFVRCNKDSIAISSIVIADSNHLWMTTNKGVVKVNTQTKKIEPFTLPQLAGKRVRDICQGTNGMVYFGCNDGLAVYNANTKLFKEFFFPHVADDSFVQALALDQSNNAWLSIGYENNRLVKLNADLQQIDI